jgi:putative NADH-flavin reductase
MKISIFGASGATGLLLTERCLAAGHEVTALLRTPEKFPFRERVRVVQGNVFDAAAVRQTLEGAEVVLSALGARSLRREDVLERGVPLIVAAMRQAGVRRIIALGAAGTKGDAFKRQPAVLRWMMQKIFYRIVLKWPIASQVAQWEALSASGLDWTMVTPPKLTNGKGRGARRVDADALPRYGLRISRADVADFMMQQIGNPQWAGKGVYVAW